MWILKCFDSRLHPNDLWTDWRHVCITSRRGTCFWDGRPFATKCEKNGKAYVDRVPGKVSEVSPNARIRSFPETAILCFASRCSRSLISQRTSRVVAAFCRAARTNLRMVTPSVVKSSRAKILLFLAVRRRSRCTSTSNWKFFYRRFSQRLAHCKISAKYVNTARVHDDVKSISMSFCF